jgi:hypothetical protein
MTSDRAVKSRPNSPLRGREFAFGEIVTHHPEPVYGYTASALALCRRNRILATAVLPRRTAHDFLKSFGEGARGFVAERLRDFGDGIAAIRHSLRG